MTDKNLENPSVETTPVAETATATSEKKPRTHERRQMRERKPHPKRSRDPQPHPNTDEPTAPTPQSNMPPIEIKHLREKPLKELHAYAQTLGMDVSQRSSRPEIIFNLLKKLAAAGHSIISEGVLEVVQDGSYGFLRSPHSSFLAGPDDIYVSPSQIRRLSLKTGDTIKGTLRRPKDNERYFALAQIDELNYSAPDRSKRIIPFRDLTAEFPNEWLNLENPKTQSVTGKIIDMIAPIGKGQRSLIVSQPKAGKTMMLQDIAQSIADKNPEIKLLVLLIDERPEEVTEMKRNVRGEVVASTFDEPAARHVQVAEMVLAKAKRLVEHGYDVVILLDSITRLARAYNTVTPASGKILTGGIESNALQKPKRLFGAARNISGGGSLSIIATALIDTGSKADEVIYEEFKGTGNNEIHLSRNIAQKRVYPAINLNASGTRREDFLVDKERMANMWVLRKYLQTMDEVAAIELLIEQLKKTKSVDEFFKVMKNK